ANFNVTALLDTSGTVQERYTYAAFGQITVVAPDWSARSATLYDWRNLFQGVRHDWYTGTDNVNAREYSATLGRPLQSDPLGLGPDMNWYRWEANNPANLLDPTGLSWLRDNWGRFKEAVTNRAADVADSFLVGGPFGGPGIQLMKDAPRLAAGAGDG